MKHAILTGKELSQIHNRYTFRKALVWWPLLGRNFLKFITVVWWPLLHVMAQMMRNNSILGQNAIRRKQLITLTIYR